MSNLCATQKKIRDLNWGGDKSVENNIKLCTIGYSIAHFGAKRKSGYTNTTTYPDTRIVTLDSNNIPIEIEISEYVDHLDVYVLNQGGGDGDILFKVNDNADPSTQLTNMILDNYNGDNIFYIEAVYNTGRKEAVSSNVVAVIDGMSKPSDYYTEGYNYSGNYYQVYGRTDYIHNMLKVNIESGSFRGNKIHFTYGGVTQTHIVYHFVQYDLPISITFTCDDAYGSFNPDPGVLNFNATVHSSSNIDLDSSIGFRFKQRYSDRYLPTYGYYSRSALRENMSFDYPATIQGSDGLDYEGVYNLDSLSRNSYTKITRTKNGYVITQNNENISFSIG